MNKPSKCKNCQWYGKPYWSVINPCDNCNREDYYKVMESYYTEDYVKSLLQQIQELTNNWNELEEWVESEYNRYYNDTENLVLSNVETMDYSRMLDKMKEIKDGNNEK